MRKPADRGHQSKERPRPRNAPERPRSRGTLSAIGRRASASDQKSPATVDPMNRTKQSRPKALPKRLRISIGGYFGPCYSVTLEEGRLIYTYSARGPSGGEPKPEWPLEPKLRELLGLSPLPGPDEIQPSAKQWQAFRTALNRLNVWSWQAKYSDPAVCDGTGLVR